MSWTKLQIVSEAYSELGLPGYEFDTSPEEQLMAVRRLDALMATWEGRGLSVGYKTASSPDDADPNDDSGLSDTDSEAAYLNLAIRLAPTLGKQISQDTRIAARNALDAIRARIIKPLPQQYQNTLSRGAGHRGWRVGNFYPIPDTEPLLAEESGLTIKD